MKTPASFSLTVWRAALATAALSAILALPAEAQDRSDTGRRKPPAPVRPVEAPAPVATPRFTVGGDRWLAGVGLGTMDGGDLFRAETASGLAVPWGQDGRVRFTASRFTATISSGSAVTAFAARRLGGGRWWLRGQLARGASDLVAEALQGQGGEVFLYDRLTFLSAALGVEARLTAWPSHPYAAAGLTMCRMTADLTSGLDQTGAGFQATLGYRQRVRRAYLALETQLRRISLDYNDFRPSVATGSQPEIAYAPAEDLWLVEVRFLASRSW